MQDLYVACNPHAPQTTVYPGRSAPDRGRNVLGSVSIAAGAAPGRDSFKPQQHPHSAMEQVVANGEYR